MPATIPETTAVPTSTPTPTLPDHALPQVMLIIAPACDGRIPVMLKVVPTANFDASGGIFVDLRLASKDPADLPTIITGDHPVVRPVDAASETEPGLPVEATAPEETTEDAGAESKSRTVSHQVSRGHKLTTGQAETFRAEIAEPRHPPEGEHWYIRARFESTDEHDLKSVWSRIMPVMQDAEA